MADADPKRTLQQSLRETWASALGAVSGAPAEVSRAAHRLFDELERRVDDGVRSAVQRVRAPFLTELAAMRGRVERLQRSVEELRRRRGNGAGPG